MKAMVLEAAGHPLRSIERETPRPGAGQLLVEIAACAACRADLHVIDGDLAQFTVLFSNTQKAHELQKTNDWVVVYFHTVSEPEAKCAIVTEARGPLEGERVVRGREGDCIACYAETDGRGGVMDELPRSQGLQSEPELQLQKDER